MQVQALSDISGSRGTSGDSLRSHFALNNQVASLSGDLGVGLYEGQTLLCKMVGWNRNLKASEASLL